MESVVEILRSRLAEVEERLTVACSRAGRQRSEVTLVAVTKTVGVEVARALVSLGYRSLGESRPQELWKKADALPDANWHLIGHLQRNKIERTVPLVALIHSVDSVRLLEALEAEGKRRGAVVPVLLEINASGEPAKHGFTPEAVPALAETINALSAVQVCGLMTLAAFAENPRTTRPTFARVRELLERLRALTDRPRQPLVELSMGMSNDFEVAVEEGATLVRLGTVLFEGLT